MISQPEGGHPLRRGLRFPLPSSIVLLPHVSFLYPMTAGSRSPSRPAARRSTPSPSSSSPTVPSERPTTSNCSARKGTRRTRSPLRRGDPPDRVFPWDTDLHALKQAFLDLLPVLSEAFGPARRRSAKPPRSPTRAGRKSGRSISTPGRSAGRS